MAKKLSKNMIRQRKHVRVRRKISGTAECPRLNVFRSLSHMYAQIIDDTAGVTLVSASSIEAGFEGNGGNKEKFRKGGKDRDIGSEKWDKLRKRISNCASNGGGYGDDDFQDEFEGFGFLFFVFHSDFKLLATSD